MGHWGMCPSSSSNNCIFGSLWSKSESQISKYYVVCEISWFRCQQLTALSISTALVTKLLVFEQLLHLALKFAMSHDWWVPHDINFHLCPSSQQILATPLWRVKTSARATMLKLSQCEQNVNCYEVKHAIMVVALYFVAPSAEWNKNALYAIWRIPPKNSKIPIQRCG